MLVVSSRIVHTAGLFMCDANLIILGDSFITLTSATATAHPNSTGKYKY